MRRPSRNKGLCRLLLSLAAAMMVLSGCEKDDDGDRYPLLISDIVMLGICSDSCVNEMILDNGERLKVEERLMSNTKDTTLRCFVSYELKDRKVDIYNISRVFTQEAFPPVAFCITNPGSDANWVDGLPRYPMKVTSIWRSGDYLNMHLGLMTTGAEKHSFAFCEDSVGYYSLLHLRPAKDEESYTQDMYMSMPFPEELDNLHFSVYTYDGIYTEVFYR